MSGDIQSLRERIEQLDHELLALLKRRMGLVEQVAEAKLASVDPFRDPAREEQIFQRVRHLAVEAGLDSHQIERLYRLILEMSVAHQQAHVQSLETAPLRVAYQGVEGAFSHLTARRRYAGRAGGVLLRGHETFRLAIDAVRDGDADLALLPIENTTAGAVDDVYDLLAEGGVTITAEVIGHVEHCLLAVPGATIDRVRVVLSHPQALFQCERFLRALPGVEQRPEYDTAGAARKVSESGDPTLAAIASESAAALYGLQILARGIQTQPRNFTRFLELARAAAPCPPDSVCKTSMFLVLAHQPGALAAVLTPFARRGINLTKIESRPIPGEPWRYRFFLDLEGHAASAAVAAALEETAPFVSELKLLGTYPAAEPVRAPADPV